MSDERVAALEAKLTKNSNAIDDMRAQLSLASRQCGLLQDVIERVVIDTNKVFKQLEERIASHTRISEQDRKQFVAFRMQREEDIRKEKEVFDKLHDKIQGAKDDVCVLNHKIENVFKANQEELHTLRNQMK